MSDTITLTREELYEIVWQKPIMRVAKEFAISDAGLAKLCTRRGIPTPPRGYWARLNAGNPPPRPPLPPSEDTSQIRLRRAIDPDPDGEHAEEFAAAVAHEKSEEKQIRVAERLHSPCTLVHEARELLNAAEPDDHGILKRPPRCLDLRVSRAQLPRALRIADALVKGFEARGWTVAVQNDGTVARVNEAPIDFSIEETLETVELPVKRDLSGSYSFHYRNRETERRPSGRLEVAIRERHHLYPYTQRRKWRDSETRALEEQLNKVAVGMLKLAAAVRADQEHRERLAEQEAERQRKLEARLAEQHRLGAIIAEEQARVDRLLAQADQWRRSQDLRRFVEAAAAQGRVQEPHLEGPELAEWVAWALRQADRLDPLAKSPPSILDDAERVAHMCDDLRRYR